MNAPEALALGRSGVVNTDANKIPQMFTLEESFAYFVEWGEPSAADLDVTLGRLGRNDGPALLFDLLCEGLLTAEAASAHVASVWSSAEFPDRNIPHETWRELFALAGYTVDGKPADRPTEALRLYRGAADICRDNWSWTDDLAVAQKFADGLAHRTPGKVWTAVVPPERLLARIHEFGRHESEYVVDTDGLTIVASASLGRS